MSFRNVISKSELLRQKRELEATKDVDKILSTKKDVILQKVSEVGPQVSSVLGKFLEELKTAYDDYAVLVASMSYEEVLALSKILEGGLEVDLKKERYMDVHYWRPFIESKKVITPTTLAQSNFFQDTEKIINSIIEAAWLKSFILKLIKDLRDTDKLINALEKVVIPETEKKIASISITLEERDREELNRIKKVRNKMVTGVGSVRRS
ncbi:MAG: V-type ATP synthase subunit D [Nitrososphaeria archaeon]|jgi:H(+)-transporting ATP synthase, vacuolar type, subunit D